MVSPFTFVDGRVLRLKMLFLAVLVIALGWAGWIWAWGRDRFLSNRGFGPVSGTLGGRPSSAFSTPRTMSMARKRRRDVLIALAIAALLTLLLARAWSVLWIAHLLIDAAIVVYGLAVRAVTQKTTSRTHGFAPQPHPSSSLDLA